VRNSVRKEISRELRSGNRLKCQECNHPRRRTYHHESGRMLCKNCCLETALNGRNDFRSKEKP
jgi:formylmethanofuran dehydrogenase subunit E